jgi:hypothetical protein
MTNMMQQPYQQPYQEHNLEHSLPPQYSHPSGYVGRKNDWTYKLVVEQQPIRARMCGFGDKDRRPITPPPCIRLVVCDAKTGLEVDPQDVDSTYFVLMVDLWNEDGSRAVNLVRHCSSAPSVSISNSAVASYPPPADRALYIAGTVPPWNPMTQSHMAQNPMTQIPRPIGHYTQQQQLQQPYTYAPNGVHTQYPQYPGSAGYTPAPPQMMAVAASGSNQNHTRNLIGMNAVNACRLNDTTGKMGFWFVLQDLSVRTEGSFRLKLSMCDVGTGSGNNAHVSVGKSPILATVNSEPFTVYSAKKFPGVIESTPLSKCFASQGIKIAIRKENKQLSNQAEYDADEM